MGQLNFYIFVVDDTLRGEHDNKTIGLLLCNGGDKVVAQYAFSGYELRIGVSGYQLTKAIPDNLRSTLPQLRRGWGGIVESYKIDCYKINDDACVLKEWQA